MFFKSHFLLRLGVFSPVSFSVWVFMTFGSFSLSPPLVSLKEKGDNERKQKNIYIYTMSLPLIKYHQTVLLKNKRETHVISFPLCVFFFSSSSFFAEQICETLKPYYCKKPLFFPKLFYGCHFISGVVQISTASEVNAYYPLHC